MICSSTRLVCASRLLTALGLAGSSALAQACGYTGGVGMESFFSADSLIDIGIFVLLLGAVFAAFPDLLQRVRTARAVR